MLIDTLSQLIIHPFVIALIFLLLLPHKVLVGISTTIVLPLESKTFLVVELRWRLLWLVMMLERMEFADFIECVLYGNHVYVIASGFSFSLYVVPLCYWAGLLQDITLFRIPSSATRKHTASLMDEGMYQSQPYIRLSFGIYVLTETIYAHGNWSAILLGKRFHVANTVASQQCTQQCKKSFGLYMECVLHTTSPFLEHMEHLMMLMLMLFVAHVARDFFESTDAG